MESRLLKSYKEFSIEKSWETKADGTMDKETVVYTAYTSDGNLFDAAKTLSAIIVRITLYNTELDENRHNVLVKDIVLWNRGNEYIRHSKSKQALQLGYKACDSGISEILQGIGDVFNYITWLTV